MNKVLQYMWVSQLLDLNGGRQVGLSLIIALYEEYILFSSVNPSRRGEGKSWGGGVGGGGGGGLKEGQKGKLCDCPGHHHLETTTLGLSIPFICLLLLSFL